MNCKFEFSIYEQMPGLDLIYLFSIDFYVLNLFGIRNGRIILDVQNSVFSVPIFCLMTKFFERAKEKKKKNQCF